MKQKHSEYTICIQMKPMKSFYIMLYLDLKESSRLKLIATKSVPIELSVCCLVCQLVCLSVIFPLRAGRFIHFHPVWALLLHLNLWKYYKTFGTNFVGAFLLGDFKSNMRSEFIKEIFKKKKKENKFLTKKKGKKTKSTKKKERKQDLD